MVEQRKWSITGTDRSAISRIYSPFVAGECWRFDFPMSGRCTPSRLHCYYTLAKNQQATLSRCHTDALDAFEKLFRCISCPGAVAILHRRYPSFVV
jgi:hypothetical protein